MEFRILGPVRLTAAGRTVAVGEPRQQAVLAVLLLEAGHIVAVDTLVDRIWGDSPPAQARRSLQAHIARIRRALADAEPGGAPLTRESGGYRLDIRPEQVDLFRFRQALRDGTDRAALRAGLDLWHGEPLAGLRGDWVERTRRTLRQEHAAAVVTWAEAELRAGDAAATITRLTGLTEEHPLDEAAATTLIRALYTVGRTAEALTTYDRIRRALRDELGADPGPALSAVYEAVLRHDLPSHAQPPPPVPAQLPVDVVAFTGRDGELATLDRLLAAGAGGEPVLVCLTGTAGAGKTATAVHWGHGVRDRFPDGQLYLDLRGYDPDQPVPPEDALAAFLTALLPAGTEIPLGATERAARFRTEVSGRRMLVVLDNAATVEQVRPLLPGTPACVVVVTSRDSLAGLVALYGAHRVDVGQLPGADAIALLRRLVGTRVDDEPVAAAALADRCVRLPLTLRLAAELAVSRPGTPLAGLVDELRAAQRTLDLLSGGDDQRAAVRSVFSWSLRQLNSVATVAFAALGRHPAPTFDGYALAALADYPLDRALAALDTLVRAHLVRPVGSRYGMHDLLKAYAAESGPPDEAAADRLYGYYLATVAAAMDLLYPAESYRRPAVAVPPVPVPEFACADEAREWLDAELATLAVLAANASARGRPEDAVVLSALLFRYLDGTHGPAGLTIHGHARTAAQATGDRAAEAGALIALGGVFHQTGNQEAAMTNMWAAHALFGEIGDVVGQSRAVANIGMVAERAGRFHIAAAHFSDALAGHDRAGDVTAQAHVLTRLGTVETLVGRVDAGREHLRQALALHRRAGHRFGEAWVKVGLGELAVCEDRLADATDLYRAAAELFGSLGHRDSQAWALDGMGRAETSRGRAEEGVRHHREALELFRAHGDRDGEASSLNGLGEAHLAGGDKAAARVCHAEALLTAERTGAAEQEARAHRGLARAAASVGDAHPHYDRAIAIYSDLGLRTAELVAAELAGLT